uniref:NADH dehydrogenase subunit 4 n=1 Tax=Xylophaga oregona TaxID=2584329 RepID=UPI002028907A|nr:NADH dehydrogenase subunit 4 [Xylophaga oregona]UPX88891.1 NADH dehydrogenase subunit 4 [Xylophaga oregona]UPX88915.1 NADH dehydrogenase subunit 4 [Xylophaga oregona]UPX88927.1 NADH dehydrogenase subunit 4 [Xylophaga oregona]
MVGMSFLVLVVSLLCCKKDFNVVAGGLKSGAEASVVMVIGVCVFFFMSHSWMFFFFFFELALIPTLWLILTWGYQPERLQAGMFMMMYTSCASMPLMIILLWMVSSVGSDKFLLVKLLGGSFTLLGSVNSFCWFFLVLGFLVKLPVYLFHSWLPKAHVEAPLSGSMLLAGVLLKLGGFGLCRVLWLVEINVSPFVSFILVSSVWGGLLCSCFCFCQGDLKALVAYSSVGHMSLCLCGVFSFFSCGWSGVKIMMFCHGLCSPMLFCLVAVLYELSHSRSVGLNKGLLTVIPSFAFFWCCFCMVNMGFPVSLNFISEVVLISSSKGISFYLLPVFGLMSFVTGGYCFYMYGAVSHGSLSSDLVISNCLSERHMYGGVFCLVILMLSFPGLDFFFYVFNFSLMVHSSVQMSFSLNISTSLWNKG